jgi:recombination protein RecA
VECIPTGSLALDLALGGGLPKGRIIEFMAQKALVKPHWRFMQLQKCRNLAAPQPLLMLSMPLDPAYSQTTWG